MKKTATVLLKVIAAAAFAWMVSVSDHSFWSFAISAAALAASAWGIGKLENANAREITTTRDSVEGDALKLG